MKMLTKGALALAGMLLLGGCSVHDAAVERVSPLIAFRPSLTVTHQWSAPTGHGSEGHYLRQTPSVVGDTAYTAGFRGIVAAVDTCNGKIKWSTDVSDRISSGVAADKQVVIVGTVNGVVIAMNPATGTELWHNQVPSEVLATPTIAKSRVFVKTESGELIAFNKTTGHVLWDYRQTAPALILRGASSPIVVGNIVVAGFSDGNLVALNTRTGRVLWKRPVAVAHGANPIDRLVDIDATPKYYRGVLYVVTYQGKIAAIKLRTGRMLWQRDMSSYSGLAVSRHRVFVTDDNGHVWALNRETGRIIWQQDKLEGRRLSEPTIIPPNAVAVGDFKGFVHFLSLKDGHFLARQPVGRDRIIAAPIWYRNTMIVHTSGGKLAEYTVAPLPRTS